MKIHKLYYKDHSEGYQLIHEKPNGTKCSLGLHFTTSDGAVSELSCAIMALNNVLPSGEIARLQFPNWVDA